MFYISSRKNDTLFGVTDTKDGVEEFYNNRQLIDFYKQGLVIYGLSYWDNNVECTPIVLNRALNSQVLREKIEAWRKLHNPWTGIPVRDYLASAKIGTVITVEYQTRTSAGRKVVGMTRLIRQDYDEWVFEDNNSTFDGDICTTDVATGHLESCAIYCTPVRIIAK